SRVLVGLTRIRGVGPHGVINDLCSFAQVHVHCGFQHIHSLLKLVVAGLADVGQCWRVEMVLVPVAMHGWSRRIGGKRSRHNLRVELAKKSLAFFLKLFGIRQRFDRRDGGNGLERRNSLRAFAYWAGCKSSGVISLALGAWQTVPGIVRNRVRGYRVPVDFTRGSSCGTLPCPSCRL